MIKLLNPHGGLQSAPSDYWSPRPKVFPTLGLTFYSPLHPQRIHRATRAIPTKGRDLCVGGVSFLWASGSIGNRGVRVCLSSI